MKKYQPLYIDIPPSESEEYNETTNADLQAPNELRGIYRKNNSTKHIVGPIRKPIGNFSPKSRQYNKHLEVVRQSNQSVRTNGSLASKKSLKQQSKIKSGKDFLNNEYSDSAAKKPSTTKNTTNRFNFFENSKPLLSGTVGNFQNDRTLPMGFSMTPKGRITVMSNQIQTPRRGSPNGLGFHRASSKELGNRPTDIQAKTIFKAKTPKEANKLYKALSIKQGALSPNFQSSNKGHFFKNDRLQSFKFIQKNEKPSLSDGKSRLDKKTIGSPILQKSSMIKNKSSVIAETVMKKNGKCFLLLDESGQNKTSALNSPSSKGNKKIRLLFNKEKPGLNSPKSSITNPVEEHVVDFAKIKDWRSFCSKLRDLESYLRQLLEAIENKKDPYDVIRQYVDFIQDREFHDMIDLIKNVNFQKTIKEAFVLERWIIFVTFYMCLEQILGNNHHLVLRIVILIYQNLIYFLKLIYLDRHYCKSEELLKTYKSFLKRSILPKNVDFYMFDISKKDLKTYMDNSILSMKEFLVDCLPLNERRIDEGIESVLSSGLKLDLDDTLDVLLDSFCEYFVKKGIVTVECSEDQDNYKPVECSADTPFISKSMDKSKDYTLILDLDETLVHFTQSADGGQVLLRPHVHRFLNEVARYYEVIVFTAAQQDYADWIIDRLDQTGCISHRLYRQHTYVSNNANIKDLEKVGRDLSKTIIIDNIAENFQFHSENGIYVKSWFNDPYDTVLLDLIPLLKG